MGERKETAEKVNLPQVRQAQVAFNIAPAEFSLGSRINKLGQALQVLAREIDGLRDQLIPVSMPTSPESGTIGTSVASTQPLPDILQACETVHDEIDMLVQNVVDMRSRLRL